MSIVLDTDSLASQFKEIKLELQNDLNKSVEDLTNVIYSKASELASSELNSTKQTFLDNLSFKQISEGVWEISIGEKAVWIEEGIDPDTDMKPGLLKGASKTSKDGGRYRVIPFEHSKASSQMTPQAQSVVNELKQHLQAKGLGLRSIEKTKTGEARLGKLHSLSFDSARPNSGASTPTLHGVTIYQSKNKLGAVRRDVLTFRTVSSDPRSAGKWIHPGLTAKNFIDRALEWSLHKFEEQILPAILDEKK